MSPGLRVTSSSSFLPCKDVLEIEPLDMEEAIGGLMKEKDLSFGSRRESAGNGDGFGHCNLAAQLVLARLTYLAGDGKERLLKVLKIDINDRDCEGCPSRPS